MEHKKQQVPEVIVVQPPPYSRPDSNQVVPISNIGAPSSQSMDHRTPVVNQQHGGWSTGIYSCTSDSEICWKGVFCYPCLECQVASDMGEAFCLPYCVPGWLVVLRTLMRKQRNIQGSVMDDCRAISCCPQLVLCQLAREIKAMRQEQNS